jgi:hypothetical protein
MISAMRVSDAPDQRLLEALLDSWDRNNAILLNLLRARGLRNRRMCFATQSRCAPAQVVFGESQLFLHR